MLENRLATILETMDLPEDRKDIKRQFNVRWLLRNVQIQNGEHPRLEEVFSSLRILLKRRT